MILVLIICWVIAIKCILLHGYVPFIGLCALHVSRNGLDLPCPGLVEGDLSTHCPFSFILVFFLVCFDFLTKLL